MDSQIVDIDIDTVVCRTLRESSGLAEADIDGLAQSIVASGGIMQPLLGWRNGTQVEIYSGARLIRAARQLGLKTVPVKIEPAGLSEAEVVRRQLVLDVQHVGLNPMERSNALRHLMQVTGWSATRVSTELGCDQSLLSKLGMLQLLSPAIQTLVASGRLGYSTAYEIAKIPDAAKRDEISTEALLRPMTRKQVRDRAAGRVMTVSRQSAALKRERVVLPLGDGRSVTLAAPVIDFPGLTAALQTLLETVRRAAAEGRSLPELAKVLRSTAKQGRAA